MNTILLIGSSIFQAWTSAPALFPHCYTVNRAVGGTVTSDWTSSVADTLDAESPDVVWYYCGSNDLNGDIPQDEIRDNVLHCRREIHSRSTSIKFAYFGIIKAPQKEGKWDVIEALNRKIQAKLKQGDLYVDTNAVFFPGTEPDAGLFLEDGLHLTANGYTRLSNYAAPIIEEWLNTSDARDGDRALTHELFSEDIETSLLHKATRNDNKPAKESPHGRQEEQERQVEAQETGRRKACTHSTGEEEQAATQHCKQIGTHDD